MTGDLLTPVWSRRQAPAWSLREWETALGQARQCRLLARLATHFRDQGWLPNVPTGPACYLHSALHAAERQRNEVLWEVDRVEAALADVDTPIVILKGAAYVLANLPPARGRVFSDIDIMVAKEKLAEAEQSLFGAGWIAEHHDDYDDRYYRQWMHELPPLRHVQRGTVMDLHHTIAPPTSRYRVDGANLLSRARPLKPGSRLCVLAPEDMVLHSAVHLMQEGEFATGLRDLLDMRDLLQHFGTEPKFWPTLADRAGELRLAAALALVLAQLHRLGGVDIPANFRHQMDKLAPERWPGAFLTSWLTLATRPMHPSCDSTWSPLARGALYVRSHWIRMPLRQVLPHLIRKAYLRRFRPAP